MREETVLYTISQMQNKSFFFLPSIYSREHYHHTYDWMTSLWMSLSYSIFRQHACAGHVMSHRNRKWEWMTFIQATQSAVEFIYTQQMNIQKTQRQEDIKPTETTNYASKSNIPSAWAKKRGRMRERDVRVSLTQTVPCASEAAKTEEQWREPTEANKHTNKRHTHIHPLTLSRALGDIDCLWEKSILSTVGNIKWSNMRDIVMILKNYYLTTSAFVWVILRHVYHFGFIIFLVDIFWVEKSAPHCKM